MKFSETFCNRILSSSASYTTSKNMALRWGIVGAGLISNEFAIAMSTLDPAEHVACAVAARDLQNAKRFANEHSIKKAYGSYKELFQDPDIGRILE